MDTLHEDKYTFLSHLAQFFLEWDVFQTKFVEKIKTNFVFNNLFFRKSCRLWDNVNCTLVQALRLCTGHTTHRGSRGIALPFHDHGTKSEWGVSVTPRPLFTPGKVTVPIVQEAGWAPGLVWRGAENLVPTGTRSPDHPARSQSLYRLRYPAHSRMFTCMQILYVYPVLFFICM